MKKKVKYPQGGDAKAITVTANAYYGGYKNMFEVHGWPERGDKLMTSAPARIVEAYGSIEEFEALHRRGDLMFPMEAIRSKPPNVWLTSYYGFNPEVWGFLGFTEENGLTHFLKNSRPGVLVVIYGATGASAEDRGKILGIQQCSHQIGNARDFMPDNDWIAKENNSEHKGKWDFAVKATRAWRVVGNSRIDVSEFALQTYEPDRGRAIGAWGMRLISVEAMKILGLSLQEVQVYKGEPIDVLATGVAKQVLAPSKAGPVSQCPFVTTESEGPKHLYILKLVGDAHAFLGEPANGKIIVKAGFSGNPDTRRNDHNRTLPKKCAFSWEILFSGPVSGYTPHPSSDHAKAGERAMQRALNQQPRGTSLGGEFFLAEPDLIRTAWRDGNQAAKEFKK